MKWGCFPQRNFITKKQAFESTFDPSQRSHVKTGNSHCSLHVGGMTSYSTSSCSQSWPKSCSCRADGLQTVTAGKEAPMNSGSCKGPTTKAGGWRELLF